MRSYRDIDEAWFGNLLTLRKKGYLFPVQKGSYEGSKRLQIEAIHGCIENPFPIILPAPLNVPAPTNFEYVVRYFKEKLLGDIKSENEQYTYGERIKEQLERIIELLMEAPYTNQACIEIAQPSDIDLDDPPCLRTISFIPRPDNQTLNMGFTFRSWDLWGGFPTNVGGLAMLLEYVAGFTELNPGKMFYTGFNAHIYDYTFGHLDAILNK